MNLDTLLQQLALKYKNFVVLDLNFPHGEVPGFARAQEHRYFHTPLRCGSALALAEGLALSGFLVLLLGFEGEFLSRDATLPIRRVRRDPASSWASLEPTFLEFGTAELLLPPDDFYKLGSN